MENPITSIESASELHDDLVAMMPSSRAQRWAQLYGMARAHITLGTAADKALAELDAYDQELFPEDREPLEKFEELEPIERWAAQ